MNTDVFKIEVNLKEIKKIIKNQIVDLNERFVKKANIRDVYFGIVKIYLKVHEISKIVNILVQVSGFKNIVIRVNVEIIAKVLYSIFTKNLNFKMI